MNQEPFHQSTHLSSSGKTMFTAKSTSAKAIGWVCIVFFLFCAVASYSAGQGSVSPFFLLFVALGVFLILITGELSMSSEEIIYTTPLAKYQMKWDEVKKVEIDLQGGGLVFYANDRNKRMAVLGPGYWSGPDKQNLAKLLSDEMEKRQIPMEQTPRAAYTMSKNTKVK
jgi:hypothetical protein